MSAERVSNVSARYIPRQLVNKARASRAPQVAAPDSARNFWPGTCLRFFEPIIAKGTLPCLVAPPGVWAMYLMFFDVHCWPSYIYAHVWLLERLHSSSLACEEALKS